jgi:hypothetical protein
MGLLQPLRRFLQKHRIYLLRLPSETITPGTLLNGQGEVLQHLADMEFFGDGVQMSEPLETSALLDQWTHSVNIPQAGLSVGVPQIASLKAGLSVGREVKVEVGPLKQRKLLTGTANQLGRPNYLTDLDYLHLLNSRLDEPDMAELVRLMQSRKAGLPSKRQVDIVASTVYAEWLKFTFYGQGKVELGVELEQAVLKAADADASVGVEVEWTSEGSLLWKDQAALPIGFTPVRYAWWRGRFISSIY